MSDTIGKELANKLFAINRQDDLEEWLAEAKKSLKGATWKALGGNENNVHTVEVASDPALALVERPTNSIDALLELRAAELGETAASPHAAAARWWKVPKGGLSEIDAKALTRLKLADQIVMTVHESDDGGRPTISIQDQGTGQHPDDFEDTLLSLHGSNKKGSRHLMGVYGAGGSASYKFARSTIVISRRAPQLLDGRPDEIGITIVRYNPLDAEQYKTGRYEFLATVDGKIPRLKLDELPEMPYGTHVRMIEYQIQKYAGPAYAPQRSLYQLLHAALPDPALPMRIVETRKKRYAGVKGDQERRQVAGLLYLLNRPGTSQYAETRTVDLGDLGRLGLKYYVVSAKENQYTTADQALTISLNGQRQHTKSRAWLKSNLELFFLFKRIVVVVDATELSNEARRQMFASTRETGVDTPLAKKILDLVVAELQSDEDLYALEEEAKKAALQGATQSTTAKVKKQLANEIGAFLKGSLPGTQGGTTKKKRKKKKRGGGGTPRSTDDSAMLEIPDKLTILNDPVRIEPGETAALRLELNAKNDFFPLHEDQLNIVLGPELKDSVSVRAKGRLLGGRARVTLVASPKAEVGTSSLKVALVIPELGVMLSAESKAEIVQPKEEDDKEKDTGSDLDININWVGQDKWETFDWDDRSAGNCQVYRDDPADAQAITKVEWNLNEDFEPLLEVSRQHKMTAATLKRFRERYEYPVALGLFYQSLAQHSVETETGEVGGSQQVSQEYSMEERFRLASAVLAALQPEVTLAEVAAEA